MTHVDVQVLKCLLEGDLYKVLLKVNARCSSRVCPGSNIIYFLLASSQAVNRPQMYLLQPPLSNNVLHLSLRMYLKYFFLLNYMHELQHIFCKPKSSGLWSTYEILYFTCCCYHLNLLSLGLKNLAVIIKTTAGATNTIQISLKKNVLFTTLDVWGRNTSECSSGPEMWLGPTAYYSCTSGWQLHLKGMNSLQHLSFTYRACGSKLSIPTAETAGAEKSGFLSCVPPGRCPTLTLTVHTVSVQGSDGAHTNAAPVSNPLEIEPLALVVHKSNLSWSFKVRDNYFGRSFWTILNDGIHITGKEPHHIRRAIQPVTD